MPCHPTTFQCVPPVESLFLEILEMETKNQDELLYRVVPYIQLYINTSKKSEINLPMPTFLYLRKLVFNFFEPCRMKLSITVNMRFYLFRFLYFPFISHMFMSVFVIIKWQNLCYESFSLFAFLGVAKYTKSALYKSQSVAKLHLSQT